MGCMTKHNVVSQCKHRKNLLQLTIGTRDILAKSQCKYNLCLLAVAKSLRLIASKHSSPSSLDLTSYPFLHFESHEASNNHSIINTTSLKQTRSKSNLEASSSSSSQPGKPTSSGKNKRKQVSSSVSSQPSKTIRPSSSSRKDKGKQTSSSTQPSKPGCSSSSYKKGKGKEKLQPKNELKFETIHEEAGEGEKHYYDEEAKTQPEPLPEPPLERDDVPEWDFFRPYDELKAERENDEDHLRRVRKEEGIAGLDKVEESETKEANSNASEGETNNCKNEIGGKIDSDANDGEIENGNSIMTVNGGGTNQIDLLNALKQIEENFLRAFESGLDVSKMLEVKKVHLKKGWERVIGERFSFLFHNLGPACVVRLSAIHVYFQFN